MTVAGVGPSVREALIRLHPLVSVALKHGAGLDDATRGVIGSKTMEWCAELLSREPDLSFSALSTAVHTRLRLLMAAPGGLVSSPVGGGAEDAGAKPVSPHHELLADVEAITGRRTEAVNAFLTGLQDVPQRMLKLSVGDGLSDLAIAARLGVSSEHVERELARLTREVEDVWLDAGPAIEGREGPAGADDAWFLHYVPYVRGKLDPDRVNLVEQHAFDYVRTGARLAALQAVHDLIRSGEWRSGGTRAKKGSGLAAQLVGSFAAVVVVGVLAAFVVSSSTGRYDEERRGVRMSIMEPAPVPPGLAPPPGSGYEDLWNETVAAYERGDYSEAADGWKRLQSAGLRIDEIPLFLGVSQLLSGHADRAAETLARQVPPGRRAIPYHFYRAQSLLMVGRVEEAREELRAVLTVGDSEYRKDAERQLTTLLNPVRGSIQQ